VWLETLHCHFRRRVQALQAPAAAHPRGAELFKFWRNLEHHLIDDEQCVVKRLQLPNEDCSVPRQPLQRRKARCLTLPLITAAILLSPLLTFAQCQTPHQRPFTMKHPVYLDSQLRLPGALTYLGCAKAASTPRMFSLRLPNFKAKLTGVNRDDRVDAIS
jgi:hypothetical protein